LDYHSQEKFNFDAEAAVRRMQRIFEILIAERVVVGVEVTLLMGVLMRIRAGTTTLVLPRLYLVRGVVGSNSNERMKLIRL
jgi:hypothetical protein